MKLEYVDSLTLAHPFIKGFDQALHCLNEEEVRACAQGEASEAILKRQKEEIDGKEGASTIYTTTFYIGLAIEPKQRAFDHFTPLPYSPTAYAQVNAEQTDYLKLAPLVQENWIFHIPQQSSPSS